MNKTKFYFLSFTWGLPLTLVGLIVAAVLLCRGKKPKKWGACYYFEIDNKNMSGFNLGIIFLTGKNPSVRTRNHEHGHAIQNCYLGVLTPFIVHIPSVIRFWYRVWLMEIGKRAKTPYDAIWFERTATELGNKYAPMWN